MSSWEWLSERVPYPWPETGENRLTVGAKRWELAKTGDLIMGDTYPFTWADDGEMYTSAGDPYWGGKEGGLDLEKFSGGPGEYRITRVNPMPGYEGNAGEGAKPSGMVCVDGALHFAFQNLLGKKPPAHREKSQHGSDAAIVRSRDHGLTWEPDISSLKEPQFPGSAFGGPAFVNAGRNHADAPDGFVYAASADQWDNGTHLRLGRVPRGLILERAAWEWVAAVDAAGRAAWSRRLDDACPVLSRETCISLPDMVFLARAARYVLLTWRLADDYVFDKGSSLMIYEARSPWGPFVLVHEEDPWETVEMTPYCPRLPLKWTEQDEHGVTGWLQFSGRPGSAYYRSHVRRFRLRFAP